MWKRRFRRMATMGRWRAVSRLCSSLIDCSRGGIQIFAAATIAMLMASGVGHAQEAEIKTIELSNENFSAVGNSLGGDFSGELMIEEAVPVGADADVTQDDTEGGEAAPDSDESGESGDESEESKDSKTSAGVQRPKAAAYQAVPIDREVRKDPAGMIYFGLKGQPWQIVLEWLAAESAMSLDWQELPDDALNLVTQRGYRVEEGRDLINRHLLARGYTLLVNGEVMSVVKLKELNPSMVPRVRPEDLEDLLPHSIAKVSFDLEWLVADEAVVELKPMVSPSFGKINHLSRTNRIEVIDMVGNLQDIYAVLVAEQSDTGQEQLVKVFRLKHRRAEEVIILLRQLLGQQSPVTGAGFDPNMAQNLMAQMQEQIQAVAQAAQEAAAAAAGGGPPGARKQIDTRLVLNPRENMILVQAMPDQMGLIEKAIEQIDVPAETNALLQSIGRMKVYKLNGVDPQSIVDLLKELGDLEPRTILKADNKKKALIAWASLADHLSISTLIERLDVPARQYEVIPLRRLEADYIAGTIRFLMGEEEDNSNNNYYESMRYYGWGGSYQADEAERDFKIDADLENNQLLIYANEQEMAEITDLLVKLGELPDPNARDNGYRVFDLAPEQDVNGLIRRLEEIWRLKNPIEVDRQTIRQPAVEPPEENSARLKPNASDSELGVELSAASRQRLEAAVFGAAASTAPPPAGSRAVEHLANLTATSPSSMAPPATHAFVSAEIRQSADDENLDQANPVGDHPAQENPPPAVTVPGRNDEELTDEERRFRDLAREFRRRDEQAPPVRLSVTRDGKLLVTSDDPRALREMEVLIAELAPPRRDFELFTLEYARPTWVVLNLKDFFRTNDKKKSGYEYDPYFGFTPSRGSGGSSGPRRLSKRKDPIFIPDNFTSTLLVRDADEDQLNTIRQLIALYDVPEPTQSRSMRETRVFPVRNSRASVIANTIKEVYRDLLSSNDKALQEDGDGEQRNTGTGGLGFYSMMGLSGDDGDGDDPDADQIKFRGHLSIGVDDVSNTLVVSATSSLMESIGQLIESLDAAAESSSKIQVYQVADSVDAALIQERLSRVLNPRRQVQKSAEQQATEQLQQQQEAAARAAAAAAVNEVQFDR